MAVVLELTPWVGSRTQPITTASRRPGTTKALPRRARELRGRGLTVPEIAAALNVSRRTAFRYLAAEATS